MLFTGNNWAFNVQVRICTVNRINRITDGFGKTTKIEYEYLPVFENYQTSEIEMSQPLKIIML